MTMLSKNRRTKRRRIIWLIAAILFILGMLLPQRLIMPVEGAISADYNPNSFWYYPWGKSGTHKGVDIFAFKGTRVRSATKGIVIFSGVMGRGGHVVMVMGPKWRVHYYAHLDKIYVRAGNIMSSGESIGTVGNTGNAAGKPAHLHYTIATLVPYPWRIDSSPQGWKKMFYLNPITYLKGK